MGKVLSSLKISRDIQDVPFSFLSFSAQCGHMYILFVWFVKVYTVFDENVFKKQTSIRETEEKMNKDP